MIVAIIVGVLGVLIGGVSTRGWRQYEGITARLVAALAEEQAAWDRVQNVATLDQLPACSYGHLHPPPTQLRRETTRRVWIVRGVYAALLGCSGWMLGWSLGLF